MADLNLEKSGNEWRRPLWSGLYNKIINIFFPVLSVWSVMAYMKFLNAVSRHTDPANALLVLLLTPALLAEYLFSKRFSNYQKIHEKKIYLYLRMFFWIALFMFWVSGDFPAAGLMNTSLYPIVSIILHAESYLSIAAFALWLLIYYYGTVIMGRFRLFTALLLPMLLIYALFYHFFFMGGIADKDPSHIASQPGVEVFFSPEDIVKKDYYDYEDWLKVVRRFPKSILLDRENSKIYTNYAATYGSSSEKKNISVIKIDLLTKKNDYYYGYYSMDISMAENTLIFTPWYENKLCYLDPADMTVEKTVLLETDVKPLAVSDIYYNGTKKYIILSNDIVPRIWKLDAATGKKLAEYKPEGHRFGGIWNVRYSKTTDKLYFTAMGADYNLAEMEPETLQITRTMSFGSFGSTAMLVDDDSASVFIQDGHSDNLYEIDIASFKVKRRYKGRMHSRQIILDRKRSCLYILSYFDGKLIALDLKSGSKKWDVKVGAKASDMFIYENSLYVHSWCGIVKIDLQEAGNGV